jgi:Na+-translocating ferredoxin:NAD+ oxidoreductase subunit A
MYSHPPCFRPSDAGDAMTDLFLILVATVLVNNFLLVRFLGLCPFLGVSRNLEAAFGMSLATAFVLTLSSAVSYLLHEYLLVPLDLTYLRTLSFILVIAASVQFTEIMVRRLSPLLHEVLGIYIPLIATNCAVLGVALLNVQEAKGFAQSVFFGFGASMGFALVLVMFAAVREKLISADIPLPFRGTAIALVTAGIMSLAFMGFAGMARP